MVKLFYIILISVDLAQYEIFVLKLACSGMGGIAQVKVFSPTG